MYFIDIIFKRGIIESFKEIKLMVFVEIFLIILKVKKEKEKKNDFLINKKKKF